MDAGVRKEANTNKHKARQGAGQSQGTRMSGLKQKAGGPRLELYATKTML